MSMNELQLKAAQAYENALIAVAKATDSEGRCIILLRPHVKAGSPHALTLPSSAHILRELRQMACLADYFEAPYRVTFFPAEGTRGEENFLRNLALLANAAAAALAYERTL
jgi:hypothetical protein